MRKRYQRINIGERYHVTGFIPPGPMAAIAEDRTWGLQGAFVATGAKASNVGVFARSCYMQGVNDAIDSLIKTGNKIVPNPDKR